MTSKKTQKQRRMSIKTQNPTSRELLQSALEQTKPRTWKRTSKKTQKYRRPGDVTEWEDVFDTRPPHRRRLRDGRRKPNIEYETEWEWEYAGGRKKPRKRVQKKTRGKKQIRRVKRRKATKRVKRRKIKRSRKTRRKK